MSGVAAACALLALRWYLAREADADPEEPRADEAAQSRCVAGCLAPRH